MRVFSVVGARPQFIKAAPVCHALRDRGHTEFLVHTGQHYDHALSQIFFDELGIPQPDINLGIGSGSHGRQTGQMIIELEGHILAQRPDIVLLYGDTNSTLAGALAAVKLHVPVAHVEAGLRSFNRDMPEEHNRVLTDHCADLLFCPTQTAVDLLAAEGVTAGVHLVGDTMFDAVQNFAALAQSRSVIMADLGVDTKGYVLATIHRPYNTDDDEKLTQIFQALGTLDEQVILPVHPRTKAQIQVLDILGRGIAPNVRLIPPVGYLDMLTLERNASMIMTDSGGIQKEAYFFAVPCVTLRPETEWVETVQVGWNRLAWHSADEILAAVRAPWPTDPPGPIFGDGQAAAQICRLLAAYVNGGQ